MQTKNKEMVSENKKVKKWLINQKDKEAFNETKKTKKWLVEPRKQRTG